MSLIPTIDIEPLFGNNHDLKLKVARQIDQACRKNGFFQITGHRIQNLKSITHEALRFFKEMTQDQKMQLASRKYNPLSRNTYRGYFPANVNGKEGYDIGNPFLTESNELVKLPLNETSVWPSEDLLPKFRDFFEKFYTQMVDLSRVILKGFSLAVGKPEDYFDNKVRLEDTMSTLRLNFYPFLDNIDAVEIAEDGTRLGCETHRDGSLITILYQPIEGLQVEDEITKWINVPSSECNFVINTGKCMSRWTNDIYIAANHRVKFMNVERVSVPFFTEPYYDCLIESFTPNEPEEPSVYEPIKYGVYISESMKQFKEYQR